MTIAPALMALLDKITDRTRLALGDLRVAVGDLSSHIASLKTATDKDGDSRDYLNYLAYEATDALEKLADLIEEKNR